MDIHNDVYDVNHIGEDACGEEPFIHGGWEDARSCHYAQQGDCKHGSREGAGNASDSLYASVKVVDQAGKAGKTAQSNGDEAKEREAHQMQVAGGDPRHQPNEAQEKKEQCGQRALGKQSEASHGCQYQQ